MNHTAMNNSIWTTNSQSFSYFQNLKVCRTMFDFCVHALLTETDYLTEQTETTETGGVATITEQTEQTESGQLNDEDIDNFIAENRNKNTTKKMQSDLYVFYRWAKTVNETRTIENIPEKELDKVLAHFFLNVRKTNGDEYEPDTLTSMLRCFDRFLRAKEKHYSILTDRQFTKVREALSSKAKQSSLTERKSDSEAVGRETIRIPHTTKPFTYSMV